MYKKTGLGLKEEPEERVHVKTTVQTKLDCRSIKFRRKQDSDIKNREKKSPDITKLENQQTGFP